MPSILPPRQAVLVTRMHRNGLSAGTRAVALPGATPPATLIPPVPDNPRGFRGSAVVAALDDRILAAGGSARDDWRRFEPAALDPVARDALEREVAAAPGGEFAEPGGLCLLQDRPERTA